MNQTTTTRRHVRSIAELGSSRLTRLLDLATHMEAINQRPVPKVAALRGRVVCNLFFEDSTRTRLSFDTAAKRLGADTIAFTGSGSSISKGESLRDTVETLAAMRLDAIVVRHRSAGVPWQIAQWCDAAIVNAGDGRHAHPTQALLDVYTIGRHTGRGADLSGLRVAIVGDIVNSRVARSTTTAMQMLGATVMHIGPATLLDDLSGVERSADLDAVIGDVDVLYMLRMQNERIDGFPVPRGGEYTRRFGLTPERARMLRPDGLVMHPGPINHGVEMTVDPSTLPQSVIAEQVTNGVAIRMAVLFDLLGTGDMEEES